MPGRHSVSVWGGGCLQRMLRHCANVATRITIRIQPQPPHDIILRILKTYSQLSRYSIISIARVLISRVSTVIVLFLVSLSQQSIDEKLYFESFDPMHNGLCVGYAKDCVGEVMLLFYIHKEYWSPYLMILKGLQKLPITAQNSTVPQLQICKNNVNGVT